MNLEAGISELPASDDRRRVARRPVSTSAALRGATIRCVVDVQDFSQVGARINTADPLVVGSRVLLKLPLIEAIEATVMWVNRLEAGCRFNEPLHPAAFEEVRRSAQ